MQCLLEGPDTQKNRLTCLRRHTHGDNIHLNTEGYAKIAACIHDTALLLTSRPRVAVGPARGTEQTSWLGFVITTGYGSTSHAMPPFPVRERGMRHHGGIIGWSGKGG